MKTLALIAVCVCVVAAWLVGCSSPCMDSVETLSRFFKVECQAGAALALEQRGSETYAVCTCAKDGGTK